MNLLKARLVSNWRDFYKWYTIHALGIVGAIAFAYDYIHTVREYLPDGWFKYALIVVLIARLISQEKP